MRQLILLVTTSMALASCDKAQAITPDPSNPAHCIAAFNYGAHWFSRAPRDSDRIAWMMAQAGYEGIKLKSSGRSLSEAEAEGLALTKAYANDGKAMDRLMLACGTAQAHDPEFRKQFPVLLASARKAEPGYYPSTKPKGIVTFKADRNGSVWKVDADSVRGSRKQRQGWVIIDTSKDKTVAYREERLLYQVDCDTTAAFELSKVTYGKDRQRLTAESVPPEKAKVQYWPPNTFGGKVVNFMCDPKFDGPES